MSRIKGLIGLYRLALSPPPTDRPDLLQAWLSQRQELLDNIQHTAPQALEWSIERALLAVIQAADARTHDLLVRKRRELGALMQRPVGYGRFL
ncbi:MAG: hypothetical protein NZ890_03685 [Myxococcota bacterium]|nr:hypothetical protein [Myxococcota bacterium]